MIDVTDTAEAVLDIWPFVAQLNEVGIVGDNIYQNELVEYVYRTDISSFDHALLSDLLANHYVVIVIDLTKNGIVGYYNSNLNDIYGHVE